MTFKHAKMIAADNGNHDQTFRPLKRPKLMQKSYKKFTWSTPQKLLSDNTFQSHPTHWFFSLVCMH